MHMQESYNHQSYNHQSFNHSPSFPRGIEKKEERKIGNRKGKERKEGKKGKKGNGQSKQIKKGKKEKKAMFKLHAKDALVEQNDCSQNKTKETETSINHGLGVKKAIFNSELCVSYVGNK